MIFVISILGSEIKCSFTTFYYYFDKNSFTARNIDLPRKVKYKARKKSTISIIKESTDRTEEHLMNFLN